VRVTTRRAGLAPGDATDRVRAPWRTCRTRVFKKIDSTLRGRVGAETEALMADRGLSTALLCPAFPAQKRVVVDRVLVVDGVPVSGSPLASDPEFPIAAAPTHPGVPDVIELLRPQFEHPLAWISLERVRGGAGLLRDDLARLEGHVILADAETDADLDAPAHLALASTPSRSSARRPAGALARCLGLHGSPWRCAAARRWLSGGAHPAT
jgi:uncharacterized protein YgbK (DUF1537 family)